MSKIILEAKELIVNQDPQKPRIACVSIVETMPGKFVGLRCSKGRGLILPGGKWEPGELFTQTASRELLEETGLVAINHRLVFQSISSDGYYVFAFETKVRDLDEMMPRTREGQVLAYVTWSELMSSAFAPYYELLENAWKSCLFDLKYIKERLY